MSRCHSNYPHLKPSQCLYLALLVADLVPRSSPHIGDLQGKDPQTTPNYIEEGNASLFSIKLAFLCQLKPTIFLLFACSAAACGVYSPYFHQQLAGLAPLQSHLWVLTCPIAVSVGACTSNSMLGAKGTRSIILISDGKLLLRIGNSLVPTDT